MVSGNGRHSVNRLFAVLLTLIVVFLASYSTADAADDPAGAIDAGTSVVPGEGFSKIGTIRPRHAREIGASTWSVGAETMDRDYTIYANWKQYLGPLGVKAARIQAGWAKTEQEKGKYDWAWLDEIIPDMVDQGVRPWVCLCYGNPIYAGGGGTGLGGGLPSSPEAQRAWEDFVGAFVDRYQAHVSEWEVWNEPRGGVKSAGQYADLVVRTAQTIRKRQPAARIIVAAGGAFDVKFVDALLLLLRDQEKLHLVDEVTYHPYAANPDSRNDLVAQLGETVATYSDRISIRQGENGAPSRSGSFGALSAYDWSEQRQAKWAVRRLLGDRGRDIPSSYFAICDMAYRIRSKGGDSDLRDDDSQTKLQINSKGLLAINDDRTIHHDKKAYHAVQHVTAVFDDTVRRVEDNPCRLSGGAAESSFSVFRYRTAGRRDLVAAWRDSDQPGERTEVERVTLVIPGGRLDEPVWVDMLSGAVYRIGETSWTCNGSSCTFRDVPVYDSVVLIADRRDLPIIDAGD